MVRDGEITLWSRVMEQHREKEDLEVILNLTLGF